MDARYIVLLVLAVLGLIKSISGLVSPQIMKRVSERWVVIAGRAGKGIAVLCVLLGGALWALVLYHQEIVDWILLAYGMALGWCASMYLSPEKTKALIRKLLLERSNAFIRFISFLGVLVTSLLIWIAIRG